MKEKSEKNEVQQMRPHFTKWFILSFKDIVTFFSNFITVFYQTELCPSSWRLKFSWSLFLLLRQYIGDVVHFFFIE